MSLPLPTELTLETLSYLNPRELIKLCEINREFAILCRDESLWKEPVRQRFGEVEQECNSWYQTFKIYVKHHLVKVFILTVYFGNLTETEVFRSKLGAIRKVTDDLLSNGTYVPGVISPEMISPQFRDMYENDHNAALSTEEGRQFRDLMNQRIHEYFTRKTYFQDNTSLGYQIVKLDVNL